MDYKDGCLPRYSEGNRCLCRLQCVIFLSHLQWLVLCHLYCCTLEMMIHVTCVLFKRMYIFKLSLVSDRILVNFS